MIAVCPFCQKRIAASEPLYGTAGKCPGCGAKIRLPGAEGGEAQGLEAPATAPVPAAAPQPEIEMAAAPPPPAGNVPSPAYSPIPRAVPMGHAPVMQRRGKVGAGLGVGGAIIVLIVIRLVVAGIGGAVGAGSQSSAVKFNDSIANADKGVLQTCEGFARELGGWLGGGSANVEALRAAQATAKQASQSYWQRLNALDPPDSDEALRFKTSAHGLSSAYQDITDRMFTEVITIVGDGKAGTEPGMKRVREILVECDQKLGVARRILGDAQSAFAQKHNIKLVVPK